MAVNVEPISVGLCNDHLSGPVRKGPVKRGNCSKHRDSCQRDIFFQYAGSLRDTGALGKQMNNHKGGTQGDSPEGGRRIIPGELTVIELSAHQSFLIDPFEQHRCARNQQGADPCSGVPAGLFHPPFPSCREVIGTSGEISYCGPLSKTVKIKIPAPQVLAVLCKPVETAASP